MKLEARLSKLEEGMTTNDLVVYSVRRGEDPEVKKSIAWKEYLDGGGLQDYVQTTFVQINEL